jgi:REP element-mobilizing transposase RayT
MPNHIHGIIQIGKNEYNKFDNTTGTNCGRDAMHGVSTTHTSNENEELLQRGKNKQGPQRKNLSLIIRGFKSSVTIEARKINAEFRWQSRFDDRIIRDEQSLNRIRAYIRDNPKNWRNDELNPENV